MKYKVYHNPRCRKSRECLEYISSKTTDLEVIDYMKKGISREEIREILLKLNAHPQDLIRENEALFKKELKTMAFNDDEWIHIISESPRLLRRPFIVGRYKAVLGDTRENIEKLF